MGTSVVTSINTTLCSLLSALCSLLSALCCMLYAACSLLSYLFLCFLLSAPYSLLTQKIDSRVARRWR
jgi:hypothetical protein